MKKLFTLSALGLTILLAGCSQNKATSSSEESATSAQSQIQAKEGTITYLGQDYTLKFPTTKIVTASFESMEDAAALSVEPLGGVTVGGEMPDYLKGKLGDKMVNIGDKFGPNVEAVAALQPDLILGSTKFDKDVTNNLSKIAPTINVSHKSDDWTNNLSLMGTVSGKDELAKKLITDYQNDLESFKKDKSDLADKKILIVRIREGELCIYGPDFYYNPMLYKDLGFQIPSEVSAIKGQTTISKEQLAKIDTDIILVQFMPSENKSFPNALNDLKEDAIWNSIPAVSSKQVFYNIVDGGYQGGTYLSKEVMLKALNENKIG
ncbi:iron-siderophore ABC transporter substrate-binding protein [Streptococcaceae bacterium ESL0729]|nr:iron-siderophore ABC transporter substrate-binding protein [Streptococcaceae bacterium ESL0729]